jgi:ATP-dependent helicase/nuclease subunit A
MPKLPGLSDSVPGKKSAQAQIEAIRGQIKYPALRFTTEQWKEGLRSIEPHARAFFTHHGICAKIFRGKKTARALDFADLERQALKLLCEGPEPEAGAIAGGALFHRQFQHVLVDEYQDINEIQDAILGLVSRECMAGKKTSPVPVLSCNLFCVGDVKQSIYAFRLADPTRFLERGKNIVPRARMGG